MQLSYIMHRNHHFDLRELLEGAGQAFYALNEAYYGVPYAPVVCQLVWFAAYAHDLTHLAHHV